MKTSGNILFCGVGGQGNLLASEITAYALLAAGMDVKKSEVHGMAQRGGSVVAQLRFGDKVYSPMIEPGTADVVVSFELMETLRYLPFMNDKTQVVLSSHKIPPPAVATGKMSYPEGVMAKLQSKVSVLPVDGFALAQEVGEVRAANVVLVGAMSVFLPIGEEVFLQVMNEKLPPKILDVNLKAFAKGREVALGKGGQ